MSCRVMGGTLGLCPNWTLDLVFISLFILYSCGINTVYGIYQLLKYADLYFNHEVEIETTIWKRLLIQSVPIVGPGICYLLDY